MISPAKATLPRFTKSSSRQWWCTWPRKSAGSARTGSNPGRFFYANLAMGMHLIEEACVRGVKKFLQTGTHLRLSQIHSGAVQGSGLWNGYPEETNAPYGVAKKALLVMCQAYRAAIWDECDLSVAGESVRAGG